MRLKRQRTYALGLKAGFYDDTVPYRNVFAEITSHKIYCLRLSDSKLQPLLSFGLAVQQKSVGPGQHLAYISSVAPMALTSKVRRFLHTFFRNYVQLSFDNTAVELSYVYNSVEFCENCLLQSIV